MGTIYHCLIKDTRYIPTRRILVYQAKTHQEAIEYLESHGGGTYRNDLHNLEYDVPAKDQSK